MDDDSFKALVLVTTASFVGVKALLDLGKLNAEQNDPNRGRKPGDRYARASAWVQVAAGAFGLAIAYGNYGFAKLLSSFGDVLVAVKDNLPLL